METTSSSNNNANPLVASEESSLKIINIEENEEKKESQDDIIPIPSNISLYSNESKKKGECYQFKRKERFSKIGQKE
jgi:hypothetical protein